MFKKTILFITLILIFLFHPTIFPIKHVSAELDKNIVTNQEKDTRPWYVIFWGYIENFMFRVMTSKDYISEEYEFTSGKATDYINSQADYSFRNLPKKLQDRLKGVWFYEVVTAAAIDGKVKYPDNFLTEKPDGCSNQIKISDIVYYFKTKTQEKILYTYESGGQPVDYPQIDARTLENEDNCYEIAYKKIQSVPKGDFLPDRTWDSYYLDSTVASVQNNSLIRLNLPQKYQGNAAPSDNNTKEKIEALMFDSKKQEITMNFTQMPEKGKILSGIDESIYDTITLDSGGAGYNKDPTQKDNILRNTARLWLTPQKWQDKNTSSTANKIETSKNTNLSMVYN